MCEIELYAFSKTPNHKFYISYESLLMVIDNPGKKFSLLKEPILQTNIPSTLLKKLTELALTEDVSILYQDPGLYLYLPHKDNYNNYYSEVIGDYKMQLLREAQRRMSVMIKEKDEIIKKKNMEIGELNLLPGAPEYYQVKQHFENLQHI